jgi:hypothetical protein
VCRRPRRLTFFAIVFFLLTANILHAGTYYILKDYYAVVYGQFYSFSNPPWQYIPLASQKDIQPEMSPGGLFEEGEVDSEFNFEAELDLDLRYGGTFSLEPGVVVGAGSEGITDGLRYDLVERILLEGRIGDRLFIEFNYDSKRSEGGIGEEKNIYSVMYRGKDDEFLKEATLGNKYLSIEDTRYIPIDEGNQDSFAVRALAGTGRLSLEGLFRYNVALDGSKSFTGFKKGVDMSALDIDYVKGVYFFLPDTQIDESSLLLYSSAEDGYDITVDGKKFTLLQRGEGYDFDPSDGTISLMNSLDLDDELIVYYEKSGVGVGDSSLGQNAIIDYDGVDPDGGRTDFNETAYPEYFDTGKTYLYLKKQAFNSYWEMKNVYFLEELEGSSVYDLQVELFLTGGGGVNSNYDDLLGNYEVDPTRGAIRFNFSDESFNPGGGFYPRPFPGVEPFGSTYTPPDPTKPFDPTNPIYGGINYPAWDKSINTLHITYGFYAESFFLDFDLVPGSVQVTVNGRVLESKYYDVDHAFGIVTFEQGVINPSSNIEFAYKYTPFGGGDRDILAAAGVKYEGERFRAKNLTSFKTAIMGEEAPDIESERKSVVKNATAVSFSLGAGEEEEGLYAHVDSEIAFSVTNKNMYGSAVIADMEGGEYTRTVSLTDSNWMVATKSREMDLLNDPYLGTRGNVLYKNYWLESFFYGDVLQTLSWNIPDSHVFEYSEKAGPYNTADRPTGGEDSSLVIDYDFGTDSTNPYIAVVTPLRASNLADYERFNLIVKGAVTGAEVRLYVEVLKTYDEDVNKNGPPLDGESSINDAGFSIVPEDGTGTVIGTDREGNSNGKIESEDLNGNGYLDTGSEESEVIRQSASVDYAVSFSEGAGDWQYVSIDILDLVESNRAVFQYANALRITLTAENSGPAYLATGSGKVLINKLWFSGAAVVNNSKEYLSIAEVTVNESGEVRNNRFSDSYSWLYDHLHGSSVYRTKNDYEEGVLRCSLDASALHPLQDGTTASISRRFGAPADLTSYREYTMFLFLPSSQTVPPSLSFILSFMSSANERLEITIPGTSISAGWNRIDVSLSSPYEVEVNSSSIGTMTSTGSLRVLKRVSEIRFGFKADGSDVTDPLEVWLDEWHSTGSKEYSDKAIYTEGTVGYNGDLLSLYGFAFVKDPSFSVGYERQEGEFNEEFDYKSDRYFGSFDSELFEYLGTTVSLSSELITPHRSEALFPSGLGADETVEQYSHSLELDLENSYIPVLTHVYDRRVVRAKDIELTEQSYRYNESDEYIESFTVGEHFDLPFGLSHAYTLSRSWAYDNSSVGYPETSFVPTVLQSADLSQTSDIMFSYSWMRGSAVTSFRRELGFTGAYGLFSEELFSSYSMKLGSLFDPPSTLLESASPTVKSDDLSLDLNIPLVDRLGFAMSFATGFDEMNFDDGSGYRDTLSSSRISLAFPFYPTGDKLVEIRPSMEREITGDYKKAYYSLSEGNILLSGYRYLFMPPFYYINPFEFLGVGRMKDYEAVDLYRESEEIDGNSMNTLSNRYSVDTYLRYDQWYIPSQVSLSFGGETSREGASYTQKRSTELSLGKYLPLEGAESYFDRSLDLTLDYKNELDYSTKVVYNSFGVGSVIHLLRSSYSGFKISVSTSLETERQRLDDPNLLLFPGDPSSEVAVSERADRDTIRNEIGFSYLWELDIRQSFLFDLFGDDEGIVGTMKNDESVTLENIYTFTDREKSGSFSNIPVRVTLQHASSYNITENVTFGMDAKAVVGIEEKVLPPSVTGNILPSMGLEFGVKLKVIF